MGRAAVVGCGIVGSTTALRLAEEGWRVTIFAREIPPDTTSNHAAAIWEPFQIEPRERSIDDTSHPEPVYLFPRGAEVFLGGTIEWDREDLEEDPATRQRILERCRSLEPGLCNSRFLRSVVGLRPGRREVRLEADPLAAGPRTAGPVVIHNYGHGGAGFTVAWGCAEEVMELSRRLLPGLRRSLVGSSWS